MLADLYTRADSLKAVGQSALEMFSFLAFLLPAVNDRLDTIGLPTEAQLRQMVEGVQQEHLAQGAAAIVDAVSPIHQDPLFHQVKAGSFLWLLASPQVFLSARPLGQHIFKSGISHPTVSLHKRSSSHTKDPSLLN